jgi:hypothetical protein
MRIPVGKAKTWLAKLVKLAGIGRKVASTRQGRRRLDGASRRRILEAARAAGPDGGASAARSQDWLYGDADGLPRAE